MCIWEELRMTKIGVGGGGSGWAVGGRYACT